MPILIVLRGIIHRVEIWGEVLHHEITSRHKRDSLRTQDPFPQDVLEPVEEALGVEFVGKGEDFAEEVLVITTSPAFKDFVIQFWDVVAHEYGELSGLIRGGSRDVFLADHALVLFYLLDKLSVPSQFCF